MASFRRLGGSEYCHESRSRERDGNGGSKKLLRRPHAHLTTPKVDNTLAAAT